MWNNRNFIINCRILDNGKKLQVVDAQLLDMGTYKCIASNAAGNATKEFALGILGKSEEVCHINHIKVV